MEINLAVNSLSDTNKLAKIIGEYIFPGMIIGLTGDLGSGKTTFTKFFGQAIGISDNLNSPTFTILKIYENTLPLYHMDVYRLENIGYDFELEEFIYGNGVTVIEWFEYIKEMLPKEILIISFRFIDEVTREITVKGSGVYERIIEAISDRYGN